MKSLVVYDSQFGNTRQLAEAIAAELREVGTVLLESVRAEGPHYHPSWTC
jgi:flavodoxin